MLLLKDYSCCYRHPIYRDTTTASSRIKRHCTPPKTTSVHHFQQLFKFRFLACPHEALVFRFGFPSPLGTFIFCSGFFFREGGLPFFLFFLFFFFFFLLLLVLFPQDRGGYLIVLVLPSNSMFV